MRIAEAFCKMRLSDFCSSHDIDRAIAVTVDSFVASQKLSCKKALARAFAKYVDFFIRPMQGLTCSLRYTLKRPEHRRTGVAARGVRGARTVAA